MGENNTLTALKGCGVTTEFTFSDMYVAFHKLMMSRAHIFYELGNKLPNTSSADNTVFEMMINLIMTTYLSQYKNPTSSVNYFSH